jgi:hypothetical protein
MTRACRTLSSGFCARARALNRSATSIPSACRIAIITLNDAMILSYDANPNRMESSERKRPPAACRGTGNVICGAGGII